MRLFLVALLVFLFVFRSNTGISQNEYLPENYPVTKKSEIKKFKLEEGTHDCSFLMTNNEKWDMNISVPEIGADEKVPLIIALHWAGGGGTYKEYSECLVFPSAASMNAIIIAPSAEGRHWVEPAMEKRLIHLVKQIKKHWPVDGEKTIITGYSNGGIGAWEFGIKYPGLFSAAIPMSGYYTDEKIKIPTYIIHGEKDELFHKKKMEKAIQASIKNGSEIEYDFLPGFSHYMACAYVEALKGKMEKIKKELWTGEK